VSDRVVDDDDIVDRLLNEQRSATDDEGDGREERPYLNRCCAAVGSVNAS